MSSHDKINPMDSIQPMDIQPLTTDDISSLLNDIDLSTLTVPVDNSILGTSIMNGSMGIGAIKTDNSYSFNWANGINTSADYSLKVKGNADIEGTLTVNGVDIGDSLKRIEERLNILRPNPRLEGTWDELRELGEKYRKLEAEILEMEKVYEALRSS